MNSKRVPIWVYLSVVITAALSLFSMYFRHKVEDRNKAVAFAAEIDTVQQLSASQGITLQQGLIDLKAQGMNAVVIPEQYVGELISGGQVQLIDGKYLKGPAEVIRRIQHGVGNRFPSMVTNNTFVAAPDGAAAIGFADLNMVRTVSVGLDPDMARLAHHADAAGDARLLDALSERALAHTSPTGFGDASVLGLEGGRGDRLDHPPAERGGHACHGA